MFLLCFSVVDPDSFESVEKKWIPDIETYFKQKKRKTPKIILIGTKIDLREDSRIIEKLAKRKRKPIKFEQGIKMALEKKESLYLEIGLNEKSLNNICPKNRRLLPTPTF